MIVHRCTTITEQEPISDVRPFFFQVGRVQDECEATLAISPLVGSIIVEIF